MSARTRSRALALALTLVPGWGHVYWGRERLGLGLFTAFAVAAFALFNAVVIYVGVWRSLFVLLSSLALCTSVLGAWVHMARLTSSGRLRVSEERRARSLREGTLAYLRGDLEAARAQFRSCIEDDPVDVEALFRLAVVCARSGDARQASLLFRRTLRLDVEEKWRWEIGRELERLRAQAAGPPVPAEGERQQV
ncbi:MAG: hypothetical protein HY721_09885 [Planctomycetes bacterium]|nr:hypothetical protein [Planctomycetota bacterium]